MLEGQAIVKPAIDAVRCKFTLAAISGLHGISQLIGIELERAQNFWVRLGLRLWGTGLGRVRAALLNLALSPARFAKYDFDPVGLS